ncbi:hypothetical protein D3C76_830320 [compost metagenome]
MLSINYPPKTKQLKSGAGALLIIPHRDFIKVIFVVFTVSVNQRLAQQIILPVNLRIFLPGHHRTVALGQSHTGIQRCIAGIAFSKSVDGSAVICRRLVIKLCSCWQIKMDITVNRIGATIFRNVQLLCLSACQFTDVVVIAENLEVKFVLPVSHSGRAKRVFPVNFGVSFYLCLQKLQMHIQRIKNNLTVFSGTNFCLMLQ